MCDVRREAVEYVDRRSFDDEDCRCGRFMAAAAAAVVSVGGLPCDEAGDVGDMTDAKRLALSKVNREK